MTGEILTGDWLTGDWMTGDWLTGEMSSLLFSASVQTFSDHWLHIVQVENLEYEEQDRQL